MLTANDQALLQGIQKRRNTIATMVGSVVQGRTNAFFLHGPGGHGKSHTVSQGLHGCERVKRWRADMSARALVDRLQEFPDHIHVLEDMERVYKDEAAQGVLRAACGNQETAKRIVSWQKFNVDIEFAFSGGIIILSNDPLDNHGRLGAVASRFTPQLWKLSDPELAATMRQLALSQDYGIPKDDAGQVAEFVIGEMSGRKVDLRTFVEFAIPDYRQWRDGLSHVDWRDTVRARIQGAPVAESRRDGKDRLQPVACEVFLVPGTNEDRLKLWKERTGFGKQSYYDRLNEAKKSGLFAQIVGPHLPDGNRN